jgi:hypothetical protein
MDKFDAVGSAITTCRSGLKWGVSCEKNVVKHIPHLFSAIYGRNLFLEVYFKRLHAESTSLLNS